MKLSLQVILLTLTLVCVIPSEAQNPGDPVPGVGGDDPFIKLIEMAKEQGGYSMPEPVRVAGADFLFFDPLDPELGEFFSQFGAAIVAMNAGDWQNYQAYLAMVNLEKGQLIPDFGDSGIVRIDFPNENDNVQNIFVQSDGKIVVGGYTASGSVTQIAVARFLKNGNPDSTFGTNGYAVYSEYADGSTAFQYNECFRLSPLYDANGGIAEYIAGGVLSSEQAAGRALVSFDTLGNVIERTIVSYDTLENPIAIPSVNGAIVQEPWGQITDLVPTPGGGLFAISEQSEGPLIEPIYVTPDTFTLLNNRSFNPYNPDPENFPDYLVEISGAANNPDVSALFVGGNFKPGIQDPVYDTNIPFVSREELDENGGFKSRELLSLPPSVYQEHGPITICEFQAPTFSSNNGVYKQSAVERYYYVMAEGTRLDGAGLDVLVWRYLSDGSVDTEFGEDGLVILDFGSEDGWVSSAFTAAGDILVCVDTGDDVALTLLAGSTNTAVTPSTALPDRVTLHSVYPNPFNPQTTVSFSLPREEKVRLTVFDTRGRVVEILSSGLMSSGEHQISWDGSNLASGLYFIRLETPSSISTQKAILLR